MFDPQLITFTGIVALLTITPGADTMLVLRSVVAYGRSAGLLATIGVCSGLFVHASLSSLGLSLILVRSATAFSMVKWVGAGYLIFLGLQSLWSVLRGRAASAVGTDPGAFPGTERPAWRSLTDGLLTNVLNPKVSIFYLAFLPQFIRPNDPVLGKSLLLAGIHVVLGIVWLSLLTLLLGQARSLLSHPRVRQGLEALAGVILIGFGVRLALERH